MIIKSYSVRTATFFLQHTEQTPAVVLLQVQLCLSHLGKGALEGHGSLQESPRPRI